MGQYTAPVGLLREHAGIEVALPLNSFAFTIVAAAIVSEIEMTYDLV